MAQKINTGAGVNIVPPISVTHFASVLIFTLPPCNKGRVRCLATRFKEMRMQNQHRGCSNTTEEEV